VKARLTLLKASVELHQRTRDDRKQQDAFNDQSTRLATQLTELIDIFDHAERGASAAAIGRSAATTSEEHGLMHFWAFGIFYS